MTQKQGFETVSMQECAGPSYVGHPREHVFMKCWKCKRTACLENKKDGWLRCQCGQKLIPLEGYEPVKGREREAYEE